MLELVWAQFQEWLALDRDLRDVGGGPMVLRTIVIYLFTLAIVRIGSTRLLGQASAFDVVVGIMLGSIMSRAINGAAPFVPTLLGGAALVGLHWLFAALSFHAHRFGALVKGNPVLLVEDGQQREAALRRTHVSERDLLEALRQQGLRPDPAGVQLAHLERNGQISIVPRRAELRVLDVAVQDGVQTVRIELESAPPEQAARPG